MIGDLALTPKLEIQEIITRYVLGQSSPREEELIEDRHAFDPDFLTLINSVEDDLIDDYVRNRLPPQQRTQFEGFFLLSPDNRDRVEFARVLLNEIDQRAPISPEIVWPGAPPSSALSRFALVSLLRQRFEGSVVLRLGLAGILIIAAGFGLLLLMQHRISPTEPKPAQPVARSQPTVKLQQQEAKSQNHQPQSAMARNENAPAPNPNLPRGHIPKSRSDDISKPVVVSFTLVPGLTRGGETNKIEIPKNVQIVELRLSVDSIEDYQDYRVSVRQIGGEEVWRSVIRNRKSKDRGMTRRSLTLRLPSHLLMISGEYLLTLMGSTETGEREALGDYAFIVKKFN